jgi:hypothetical protein
MKKAKSQNEEPIPAKNNGNSSDKGESMKIVGIDVYVDWNDNSNLDRLGTPNQQDPEWQLDDVADALQFQGFKVLWCRDRSQFHLILPEDQEKEVCRMIELALRASWKFQQQGALIKYESTIDIQSTPTCHEEDCELTALYVPALKKRLIKLVDRQNNKRQKEQEIVWVKPNREIIRCLMLQGCNPN